MANPPSSSKRKKKQPTSSRSSSTPRSIRNQNRNQNRSRSRSRSDVGVDEDYQTVTIRVAEPNPKVDPIVVSYPGGLPEHVPTKFTWRQLNPRAVAGRVVEGTAHPLSVSSMSDGTDQSAAVVYRGTSHGIGYDDRRTKLCVGIYDKQTGVVTLHQAASRGTVYALQQHLPGYQEEDTYEVSASYSLFKDFGSAKKRKVLKSQSDNRLNVEAVVGTGDAIVNAMLEGDDTTNTPGAGAGAGAGGMSESNRRAVEKARSIVKEQQQQQQQNDPTSLIKIILPDAADQAHEEARKALLPPYYTHADKAYNVYDFAAIVGEEAWGFICRLVDGCIFNSTTKKNDNDELVTFYDAMTRVGKDTDNRSQHNNPAGSPPPPEKRGWNSSTLELLKHATQIGLAEKAAKEKKSTSNARDSVKHQLRCIMIYHYLARFYTKFYGNKGASKSRTCPGLAMDQFRWFGIPRDAATVLLKNFTVPVMVEKHLSVMDMLQKEKATRDGKQQGDEEKSHRFDNPNLPRHIMPTPMQDKCLAHLLLVYLMARGGSKMMVDDITPVMEDFGIDAKTATNLLRVAGCTVGTAPGTRRIRASLTVPLTFPRPIRRAKAKGR